MSKPHVFIGLSFLIGLVCVRALQSFDRHEKEPYLKMVAVTCWGGLWSIVFTAALYMGLNSVGITGSKNTLGALFIIGPVEELAKFLALLSSYFIYRNEFDEPVDGIIYMTCVALGFSLIENFFYAARPNSGHLLLMRLFISTPMHIGFSAFMGLSFYLWRRADKSAGIMVIAFILASFSHGVFDLVIFNGYALIILFIVMGIILSWTMDLLSYATAISPHRLSFKTVMTKLDPLEVKPGIECLKCGSSEPRPTYTFGKISIQKCAHCNHYVSTRKSLFKIFRRYAATFKGIPRKHRHKAGGSANLASLYAGNFFSRSKGVAFFDLDALDQTLEIRNAAIIKKIERKWWFPKSFL